MTSTSDQSGIARLHAELEAELGALCHGSPGSVSSFATGLASSLPTLRNDSGEAVWRLTAKAMEYRRGLQGLPFRTIDEVLPPRGLSNVADGADGSAKPCV
jgi:hypothetical protein